MEKLQRRRILRTARTKRDVHARFISAYVKSRHPDVYSEADEVFNQIQRDNPGKKDMTKTDEFMKLTTKYCSRRRFYGRIRTTPQENHQPNHEDNMVLNIELMTTSDMAATIPELPPLEQHEPSSPPTIPELPPLEQHEPSSPPTIPELPPLEQHEPSSPPTIPELRPPEQHEPSSPPTIPELRPPEQNELVIPEHVYQSLLDEIASDPELSLIFNDMDIQSHDNNDNNDIWDAFNISTEPTPLESELIDLGF